MSASRRSREVSRTSTYTSPVRWRSSSSTRCRPMNPVAPVTKYAMQLSSRVPLSQTSAILSARSRYDAALVGALRSDAGARAAAAFAAGEAGGAGLRVGEDRRAGLGLEREAVGQRQPEAVDRRAPVGEHRLLGEGGEALGPRQ